MLSHMSKLRQNESQRNGGDLEDIYLSTLNKILGSVQNFYFSLLDQGWALPKWNRNSISFQYLWDVFTGRCYRLKREDLKKGIVFKKVTKKAGSITDIKSILDISPYS